MLKEYCVLAEEKLDKLGTRSEHGVQTLLWKWYLGQWNSVTLWAAH